MWGEVRRLNALELGATLTLEYGQLQGWPDSNVSSLCGDRGEQRFVE